MDTQLEPQPLDHAYLLPRDAYWQLVRTLRVSLPPPVDDTPEALAHRDNAAIAEVASLLPANASEATLAAQFVAAAAHATDCMRLALKFPASIELGLKCRAQSASMIRQSHSARRMLMRAQAERQQREADSAATDKAAWTEHCAVGLMVQALPDASTMVAAEPPPPEPERKADIDPLAAAEEYAVLHPGPARLIRSVGRGSDNPGFGLPKDHLVYALVTGRTPTLLALDEAAEECAA